MAAPVSVVILAENEEANIARAVRSCVGWARAVFVVDSFSRDRTAALAEEAGAQVTPHKFVHWADQRNWAMANLPIASDWVLFLDADEYLTTDFKDEVDAALHTFGYKFDALQVGFDFHFLGRRLRWAYRHPPRVRLFLRGRVQWEACGAREYARYEGNAPCLKSRIVHDDRKPLSVWLARQAANAEREAQALPREQPHGPECNDKAATEERHGRARWLWNRLPLVIRPFLYFLHRYVLKGGFLDGRAGFAYLFFQALWLRMLIDVRRLELRQGRTESETRTAAGEIAALPRS